MFKRLLYGIVAMTALFHSSARAQSTIHLGCNQSYVDYLSKAVDSPRHGATTHILAPASYLPSSKDTCGKIILFYEDLQIAALTGLRTGFAEPSGIGLTRRQTLCTVMGYLQSRLDFGKIPPNEYIKIHVDTSYGAIFHYPSSSIWSGTLGTGVPFYSSTAKAGDTVNGFVWEYITKGVDPNPTDFHGELRFNFDSTVGNEPKYLMGYKSGGEVELRPWNNSIGSPTKCEWDLYSVAAHNMGHVLGWFSWREKWHGISFAPFVTNLDLSEQLGIDPHGIYNPLVPSLFTPLSTLSSLPPSPRIWVNNRPVPHNSPIDPSSLSHLNEVGASYIYGTRISPGDFRQYVMQYAFSQGVMQREWTKIELETYHDIIGYNYNTTYASDSAAIIGNHTPWSSKMSYRYNANFDSANFAETVAADFSITNNIGTTLTINLNADTTLKDADGDSLSVYAGSIVNFRGAGVGGNNHNSISVSPNGRSISYTPRPNFYGRCQIGLNLFDGKEKGSFVLYTIDVQKGTNVSVSTGANLVQNGDVEEGTEVKIRDIAENVNNTASYYGYFLPGRFAWGGHYADGQYYPNGTAIRHSNVECNEGFSSPYSYGYFSQSYPFTYGAISFGAYSAYYPEAKDSIGTRYETKRGAGLYYLNDSVKKCKHYLLECDVFRTYLAHAKGSPVYSDSEWVSIGFTSSKYLKLPDSTHLIQKNSPYLQRGIPVGAWTHLKIPVSYCNDTASTVLYLKFSDEGDNGLFSSLLMDNLSLKEKDSFFVKVADSSIGTCQRRLYCTAFDLGCAPSYQWRKLGSPTVLSTTSSLDVSNFTVDKYVLTLFDGCGRSATDTFETKGCRCSPSAVFGVKTFDSLKTATLPSSLSAGSYYIAADLTVNSNTVFNGARVLIEPNVKISVANNAKLTLDNCHLLTCPDTNKLWKGIELLSVGSTSGRIEVKNNTLIEDAQTAISAVNPKIPASGDIISSVHSIYNRNQLDIFVQGLNATTPATYPFTIKSNVFTARAFKDSMIGYPNTWASANTLKTKFTPTDATASYILTKKYLRAKCKDTLMKYMGITFQNVGNTVGAGTSFSEVVIGGGSSEDSANLFDNHKYGIYSNQSNMTVYNSVFINLSKRYNPSTLAASVLPDWGGIGIFARSSPSRYDRMRIISSSGNVTNKFHDCFDAMGMDSMAEFTVSNAVVTTSHQVGQIAAGAAYPTEIYSGSAIWITGANNHSKWTVSNDTFSNVNVGISCYLFNPKSGATTNFDGNRFYNANPNPLYAAFKAKQYIYRPIEVYMGAIGFSNSFSASNNYMDKVFNGILMSNLRTSKPTVNANQISLWDTLIAGVTDYGQYAIRMDNSLTGTISNNNISTPTLNPVVYLGDRMKGLFANFNTDLKVCANTTTNMGRGFEFGGKTGQAGTRWIGNSMTNSYKGFVLGSNIDDQGFMYNWATMSPLTFYGAIGNKWLGTWSLSSSKYQTFGQDSINTMYSKLYVHTTGSTSTLELPTINSAYPFPYPPYLYSTVVPNVSLKSPTAQWDANCEGGINPTKVSTIPKGPPFKSFSLLLMADSLGYGTGYRPNQWMGQLSLYQMGIIDHEFRDSIPLLNQFIVAAQNSRFKWITDIETAFATDNLNQVQTLLANPVQGNGYQFVDSNIAISDYPEANYVVTNYSNYFAIYLRYLQGTMTDADKTLLNVLALKCPAKDGAVVYQARNLQQQISKVITQYNDEGCLYGNGGQYRLSPNTVVPNEQQYVLYPNPNNGTFLIQQSTVDNKVVNLKVYNAIGVLVYQSEATFANGQIQVDMKQKAQGVYLVCIGTQNERSTCLRFIIN